MNNPQNVLCRHIKSLHRYALALVRNPTEADDLVQECLLRALVRIQSSEPIRDIQAYLFTILHNVRADQFRKSAKTTEYAAVDQLGKNLASPPDQDVHLECRDLVTALAVLPEQQRQVVLLVGLVGFSYEQTAKTLGLPVGTVMSRLSRGREALRRMMAGDAVCEPQQIAFARERRRAGSLQMPLNAILPRRLATN